MSDHEVICPYCGNPAALVDSSVIFGHSYGMIWQCQPCDARVGCHDGSEVPLGTLANGKLRRARREVHAAFDPLWRIGWLTRPKAYQWLGAQLKIPIEECHVGMFDLDRCAAALVACMDVRTV